MFLHVTFKDGGQSLIPVVNSHQVMLIRDGGVTDSFGLNDVVAIVLEAGDVPQPTAPIVIAPPADPAPEPVPAPPAADPAPAPDQPAPPAVETQPDLTDPAAAAAHETVVQQITSVVEGALGVTAKKDKTAALAAALADVETALAQWPDSGALLDAKAQLEVAAGDLAA